MNRQTTDKRKKVSSDPVSYQNTLGKAQAIKAHKLREEKW